jgi:serine protease AprX
VVAPAAHAAPSAQAHLAAVAHRAPARPVVAIAQFKPSVSERAARRLVRAGGGRVTARLSMIHALGVRLTARQAARLERDRHLVAVTLNAKVRRQGSDSTTLGTTYPATVGADKLWAKGITGKGVRVAVIDSGVSGDLPDFTAADGSSRIAANVIANPAATTPGDPVGHGTHVAGIIAGDGRNRPAGDPDRGRYVGIAPGADLVTLKTADDDGNSTLLDVLAALQFVVDYKTQLNIRVVNLSISSDVPSSYLLDPLDAAVETAWQSGIVVVAAAGNRGNAADAVDYAPGNDPFVISVGGTDDMGTSGPGDDVLADWSSRGVTQDGFSKPEVTAPGAHIVSTLAPGGFFAQLCPACLVGSSYLRIGGTSMAAPVVAGAAALLLQARPELTPDQVKSVLMSSKSSSGKVPTGTISLDKANSAKPGTANQGIVPNPEVAGLLADVVANADLTRASWTRASWTRASWTRASWTRASWTRATWACAGCGGR